MTIHPLKFYCIENKINQKELSKLTAVSAITIHRIVNYKTRPHSTTAKKISAATGIPVTALLYPEDDDA
jgi:transcriptional regulator with XRE-family HTH domain